MSDTTLVSHNVYFIRDTDDFGPVFKALCPVCHDRIPVPLRDDLSATSCACGWRWRLVLYAEAVAGAH